MLANVCIMIYVYSCLRNLLILEAHMYSKKGAVSDQP